MLGLLVQTMLVIAIVKLVVVVIAADTQCPKDIRNVFKRILPMELNHAKWFAELSTNEHIKSALKNHYDGMNELGLVI